MPICVPSCFFFILSTHVYRSRSGQSNLKKKKWLKQFCRFYMWEKKTDCKKMRRKIRNSKFVAKYFSIKWTSLHFWSLEITLWWKRTHAHQNKTCINANWIENMHSNITISTNIAKYTPFCVFVSVICRIAYLFFS